MRLLPWPRSYPFSWVVWPWEATWRGNTSTGYPPKVTCYLYMEMVEVAIGICALLIPLFTIMAKPIYAIAYNYLFQHFWTYQIFAFLGCSLLLIIPTSLMGATLPILCRLYVTHLGHIGSRTGRLYGINTVGAFRRSTLRFCSDQQPWCTGNTLCGSWHQCLCGAFLHPAGPSIAASCLSGISAKSRQEYCPTETGSQALFNGNNS